MRAAAFLLPAALLAPAAETYEVRGTLVPSTVAIVTLHGATSPFHRETQSGLDGRFTFKSIPPASYQLLIFLPGRGEVRKTIEVGPGTAGKGRRVELAIRLDDLRVEAGRGATVSMRELQVPDAARKAFQSATKRLSQNDIPGAVAELNRAVGIAPDYAAAWNHLGTISYQTRDYAQAEKHFRRALEADANAYEPLVNLGGALLSLQRFSDAWEVNVRAVTTRPNDPLANSQMGMTYFALGKLDLAEKYLKEALRHDPGHFSFPQLMLADIYLRRGDAPRAVEQLEDFVRRHPDAPQSPRIRDKLAEMRGSPPA
jgi:Tfp pilus assembly protein PilF